MSKKKDKEEDKRNVYEKGSRFADEGLTGFTVFDKKGKEIPHSNSEPTKKATP